MNHQKKKKVSFICTIQFENLQKKKNNKRRTKTNPTFFTRSPKDQKIVYFFVSLYDVFLWDVNDFAIVYDSICGRSWDARPGGKRRLNVPLVHIVFTRTLHARHTYACIGPLACWWSGARERIKKQRRSPGARFVARKTKEKSKKKNK